ncbi:hypothetical protein JCM11251_007360 [Rhodosporidiobolus azoricus]
MAATPSTPSPSPSPVKFVRFNPESKLEVDELTRQRIICGWGADKIDLWLDLIARDVRNLYWIFPLRPEEYPLPDLESINPQVVVEGAETMGPSPVDEGFRPLGHVAIDWEDYYGDTSLADKEAKVVTLATFFIMPSQQGKKLGSVVMQEMEALAVKDLDAVAITLSTIDGECASQPAWWEKQGVKWSPSLRINEHWYDRIGYKAYKRGIPRYPYKDVDGSDGLLECVMMRKELR